MIDALSKSMRAMIIRPRVVRNLRVFGARFHISDVFLFFSSDERSAGFTNVIPRTGGTKNFISNIALRGGTLVPETFVGAS